MIHPIMCNNSDNHRIIFIIMRPRRSSAPPAPCRTRKGTNGVSTNGVTAFVVFCDGGTFFVLPLPYFYLPKSARAYLFPRSVKMRYFCSGPISVDPICPQPKEIQYDWIKLVD